MEQIKLCIADDQVMFRKAIICALEDYKIFSFDIEANNGKELLENLGRLKKPIPDICLLEIKMPILNGYETLLQLKKYWPKMKVLILTMCDDEYSIIQTLKNGANGYVLKNDNLEELRNAIMAVFMSGHYYSGNISSRFIKTVQSNNSLLPDLSERELQFLSLCCSEMTYKEIANSMSLSFHTIESYRDTLFEKLSVHTRSGLVMFAMNTGVLPFKTNALV